MRRYGEDFEERLERAGCDVNAEEIEHLFLPRDVGWFGLLADEVVYFCTNGDTARY